MKRNTPNQNASYMFARCEDEITMVEVYDFNAFGFVMTGDRISLEAGDVEIMIVWKRIGDAIETRAKTIEFEAWVTPIFSQTKKVFAYHMRLEADDFHNRYAIRNQIVEHCFQSRTFIESVRDCVVAAKAREDKGNHG
jgi:hypothetical protein